MLKTYNFRMEDYPRKVPAELEGEWKDTRNGIIAINPTFDVECYINYIELLNATRDKWYQGKAPGYLDLGMMPLAMAPSFMQQYIVNEMLEVMNKYKVPCYALPPVSLYFEKCKMPQDDLWVFKSDIAKAFDFETENVCLTSFLRRYYL